ncbi:tetratricopeptide repeat-containing sensor histidine kinase [Xanthovirga aplysinae]|uniref:tetratricopeptide repeat-containing sensor histidine kinase n=1 Tax=Xanthovirga aplysinae TaxID=2529853 RepID=UPI0012BD08B5|nr:ATP-binding protein [Xanthovirga aplysinae]MTI31128.1 tetratricopeptide repeat protein [Xanthovirga aplysinae]
MLINFLKNNSFFFLLLTGISICIPLDGNSSTAQTQKLSPNAQINKWLDSSWDLRNSNPEKAKDFGMKAIELAKKSKYEEGLIKAYGFTGVAFRNLGYFDEALKYYALGFELALKHENYEQMAYAYMNLGNLYLYLNEPEQAKAHIEKVRPLLSKLGNENIEGYYYLNNGRIMLNLKDYDKAMQAFYASLKLRKKGKNKNGQAVCLKYIGDAHLEKEQFEQALESYQEAEATYDLSYDNHLLGNLKVNQARAYLHLQQLEKAEEIAKESLYLAEQIPSIFILKEAYLVLSEIAQIGKNFESSADHLKNAMIYQDSIYNKGLEDRLERFNFSMEKLQFKYEKKIARLRQSLYLLSLLVLFVITIVAFRAYYLIKKRNKQLTAQNEEIKKLSKLKKDLISMIVHDLKNPLNAILMLTEKGNREMGKEYLRQSGRDMQRLITNMLEVNRMEEQGITLSVETIKLGEKVNRAIDQLSFLIQQKGHKVINKVKTGYYVEADIQYFDRILNNLLTNAIKFNDSCGEITIWAEKFEEGVKIFVRDTGSGIPEELHGKIFEKFWRTKSNKIGASSGLGLTFCKMAVEAHGGEMGVTSKPGEGATFWFTLSGFKYSKGKLEGDDVQTKDTKIQPGVEELEILKSARRALLECNVYEVSRINAVIQGIQFDKNHHPSVQSWVLEIERAYENGNEVMFRETLNQNF